MERKIASPRRARRAALLTAAFGVALCLSYVQGAPPALPGLALGWGLLFHIERAIALLAAIGVVGLVGWRAIDGDFPVKFGNVEYAVKNAAAEADDNAQTHERRIRKLEFATGLRGEDESLQNPKESLQ